VPPSVSSRLLDAPLNWLAQLQLIRRRERADWVVAARLVARDLRQAARDLAYALECGFVPLTMEPSFLAIPAWEEYGPVFARAIPNSDDGDRFWFGMSELVGTVRKTRALLAIREPGSPIDATFAENVLRTGIEALGRSRTSMGHSAQLCFQTPYAAFKISW
jgi:hypothetical protein